MEINKRDLNILLLLQCLLLLSLFLKLRVYPIIMISLIFINIFYFIKDVKIKNYQFILIIFLLYSLIIYFFTPMNNQKNENTFKLLLNLSYFLMSGYFFKRLSLKQTNIFFKNICKCIFILIILNLIQVVLIYLYENIEFLKIFYLKTSDDAYIINFKNIPMIVGNENKNIWSSKVAFLGVLNIFIKRNILKEDVSIFFYFLFNITILLFLSRTGILMVTLYEGLLFLEYLKKKNKYIKNCIYFILFIPSIYIFRILYFKIFRINFNNMNDGGITRLFNWNLFRLHFFQENFIFGIGLGGTPNFLEKYNSILIDGHMHNVIINIFLELGIIGGVIYSLLLTLIAVELIKEFKTKSLSLIIPCGVVLMLQYMGYDNDVIVYFSFLTMFCYYNNKLKSIRK